MSFYSTAQFYDANYDYRVEFIYGVSKGTNGGLISGFFARRGTKIKDNLFGSFMFELANIKHQKETRATTSTGKSYILGKSHYLYVVRGGYGFDCVLFKKASQHGVQVSLFYGGGLSLGVVSPYYVSLLQRTNASNSNFRSSYYVTTTVEKPYSYELVNNGKINQIVSNGNSFRGLGDADTVPGIFGKVSLTFEFGTFKRQASGFEIGVMLDTYSKEIEIMPNQENSSNYLQVFFSLYYGFRK